MNKCLALSLCLVMLACQRASNPSGSDAKSSGFMAFKPLDVLPKGLDAYANDPGWPKFPRRDYQHQSVRMVEHTWSFGIEAPLVVTEAGSTVNVLMQRITTLNTMIIATNEAEKDETVFDMSDAPVVRLNYWEGRDMVIVCIVQSSYALGQEWSNKVKVLSNGYQHSQNHKEVAIITQMSKMRRPNIGETDLQAIKNCEENFYSQKMKDSIQKDLEAALSHVFLHAPGEVCVEDTGCDKWHSSMLPIVTHATKARCIRRPNQNFFCALRAKENNDCTLYGKPNAKGESPILTRGMFEYPCDEGLVCKQTKAATWFSSAEAVCQKQ